MTDPRFPPEGTMPNLNVVGTNIPTQPCWWAPPSWGPPTFVFIEEVTKESQNGQRDKVSQAGCNGCGDVVWIDPELSSTNHYTDHQHSCREEREETQSSGNQVSPRKLSSTGEKCHRMNRCSGGCSVTSLYPHKPRLKAGTVGLCFVTCRHKAKKQPESSDDTRKPVGEIAVKWFLGSQTTWNYRHEAHSSSLQGRCSKTALSNGSPKD